MTLLSLPAGHEAGGDAVGGEGLRPVPWRRMLWVTWRQHRATFISVPAVGAVAAVFLVVAGHRAHRDYAAIAAACHLGRDSAACQSLIGHFNQSDWPMGNASLILMQLAPAAIGAFAGVPVLARELESGTFRYAWTQGVGRERWAIAKLALLGIFVAVAAGAFSQLFAWFFAPFLPMENMSVLDATVFGARGVAFAAWTLAAFTIAASVGMLLRRILPALAVALGVYLGLALAVWTQLRKFYPFRGFWPMQLTEGGWLLVLSVLLVAATIWLVRHRAS